MSERWYKEAVVYSIQVDRYYDSDGDGIGDLRGLISRLDYLSRLGVNCLWLNPIHPSPQRDNGYDVTDYYGIDPRIGTLGDFAELLLEAQQRGIRVVIDLVVNHTSDQHPWFLSARSDPASPYRNWYVWSADEPPNRKDGIVFPGEQAATWDYDDEAKAWYFHRFYRFQPDLNFTNPAVREEVKKIMGFWLQLGVSGFRVDAAPFVLEAVVPGQESGPLDFSILDDWRQDVQWRSGSAVLLCEANVSAGELHRFTGLAQDGPNDRAHMLFAFLLNDSLWLALARRSAESLVELLRDLPPLQAMAQWATFLRNHDELDLSRLTAQQQADVFRAFGPRKNMQIYDRGIRRRLAPMLRNDQRQIRLAYALQFAMPGTPVVRYGEEIGMSENLALPGRESVRTPMQWDDGRNAGFSTGPRNQLIAPVTTRGEYGAARVNVRTQQRDRDSQLRWFSELIATLRECPEIGVGTCRVIDLIDRPAVLAHRFDAPEGTIILVHNLSDEPVTVELGPQSTSTQPWEIFADGPYPPPNRDLTGLEIAGFGYRWIRLRHGRTA